MTVLIEGNDIRGCKGGIRVPSEGDIKVRANKIRDSGIAIDVYDQRAWETFGIPKGAPTKQVLEVIDELKKNPAASPEEMTKVVSGSGLAKFLGNAELVTKVATGLIALVKAGADLIK
nr:hypothetical protein [uncultured Pseudomonas sp.]